MKKSYLINGKKILNKHQLHDYLIHVFQLPEYYGRNLDALWDCLSTNVSIKTITIIHLNSLNTTLGDYGKQFINVLNDLENHKQIELITYLKGRHDEIN
jgi:ribonuclease inhibitor